MKVKTNPLERKKVIRYLYYGLIIFFVSSTLFFGRNSFLKVIMAKREVANLQKKVELLKTENDSLRKENHELKTNPDVIEKIAREQLGYQKIGEKVIRFIPAQSKEKKTGTKE